MSSQSSSRLSPRLFFTSLALVCALGATASAEGNSAPQSQGSGSARSRAAPEIDPGLAAAGLLLLTGGTLILTTRRRPKTA